MNHLFPARDLRMRYLGFDDRWVLLLGIPLITLVSSAIFASTGPHYLLLCLTLGGLYTTFYWLTNRAVIVWLRRRLPRQEDVTQRLLWMLGVALIIVVAFELITRAVYIQWFPRITEAGFGDAPLGFQITVSMVLCVLVGAVYESIYFFTQYRRSSLERERLARTNIQAQLASLREQVNPHFLFNSLNTLVNIIPEDPAKAVRFTQRLSAVYRRILEYRHHETIPLEEELTAVRDYVFLLQTRFEDNLVVNWAHLARPLVLRDAHLPPLSVQLLVENAIKHNVVSSTHPLIIDIHVEEDAVTVSNSRRPRSSAVDSTGWGHRSILGRYAALTDDRRVEIELTEAYYRVRLPLIRQSLQLAVSDAVPV